MKHAHGVGIVPLDENQMSAVEQARMDEIREELGPKYTANYSPGVTTVITVEAVVENGLLRPMQPLPLKENEQVRITIEAKGNWVQESYGLCGWKGDSEELRRLALAPDLDLEEEP